MTGRDVTTAAAALGVNLGPLASDRLPSLEAELGIPAGVGRRADVARGSGRTELGGSQDTLPFSNAVTFLQICHFRAEPLSLFTAVLVFKVSRWESWAPERVVDTLRGEVRR